VAKLIHIFVGGESFADKTIKKYSHAGNDDIVHVAGIIFGRTLEALATKDEGDLYPGTWLHRKDKYFNNPNARFIMVDVPDLAAGMDVASGLLGTPYGYSDCLKTAIFEETGTQLPDSDATTMCAEDWVRIDRGAGLPVLPDIEPGNISPVRFYRALINDHGGIDVTHLFRNKGVA